MTLAFSVCVVPFGFYIQMDVDVGHLELNHLEVELKTQGPPSSEGFKDSLSSDYV